MEKKRICWFSVSELYNDEYLIGTNILDPSMKHVVISSTLQRDYNINKNSEWLLEDLEDFIYFKVVNNIITAKYTHKDVLRIFKLKEL
jgi:hypothetical protein